MTSSPPSLLKMQKVSSSIKCIAPAVLAFSLMAVYLATIAPGLTWANDGADGGDLIAAVATHGIPHPTGYPTYLLVGELFRILPFGSLAYRMNLLSAIAGVSASLIVYWTVTRSATSDPGERLNPIPGLVAGFAFGLSPEVWSQAVIAEVYTLHAFFVAMLLYLSCSSGFSSRRNLLNPLRGLVLGLAVGNHVITILMVPFLLLTNAVERRANHSSGGWKFYLKSFLWQFAFFILGLSVYLILPWRAASSPLINWGNPLTLSRFWWLVSGQLYRDNLLAVTAVELWFRLQSWASLLLQQFGFVGLSVALVGLVVYYIPNRLYFLSLVQVFVYSLFAMVYGTSDSHLYLIPVWLSFAIWIGRGTAGIQKRLFLRTNRFAWMVGIGFLAYFLILAVSHMASLDASHDLRGETFGEQVISSAPENAIVFADGDRAVFAMWYFHFALHQRPDLAIIATDLLHFDWYQDSLRRTYPSLMIPGAYPWPESIVDANASRPACYVEYVEKASIRCEQPGPVDP